MSTKASLVVVSNRLPTSVTRGEDGKLLYKSSNGGLATAMASLTIPNRVWIGWPGIASDDLTDKEEAEITKELAKEGCIPVFLTNEQIELYYEGYSNDTLWPMFHYFQTYVQYNEEYWDAYKEVNQLFADAVASLDVAADSTIWVHDYQLLLAPGMIRESAPDATIGFFLHIPFPSYEVFRQLPNRKDIIKGMLGADLLGFHIYDYTRHFLSSVEHIMGIEHTHGKLSFNDRSVTTDSFPIGINYDWYKQLIGQKETLAEKKAILEHYEGQRIIVSVDRLDYSKGILERLEGFELFLAENPDQHKKVTHVMIAAPSRTSVEAYQNLREEIELAISRINGMYSTVDWTPISYQFKSVPLQHVVALCSAAEVGLITALRDGMNIVAMEYIIAQEKKDPGVLILSEMTGASDGMLEALTINPNSVREIADAIKTALEMPTEERAERIRIMDHRLKSYNVEDWAEDFIETLNRGVESRSTHKYTLDDRSSQMLKAGYTRANRRLLLLDYDGTLKPLVDSPDPDDARPSKQIINTLKALSKDERTRVVVISGRSKAAMEDWFGSYDDLTLVAEHGAWVRKNGSDWSEQHTSFEDHRDEVIQMLKKYALRTPGAIVEQKSHSIVWHYRNVPSELAFNRNESIMNDLERILENTDITAHNGKKIIEIKPDSVDKGRAAEVLYKDVQPDFTICIGDDFTDEDMFKALPEEAITIKVGEGPTDALLRVSQVRDVQKLLSDLTS